MEPSESVPSTAESSPTYRKGKGFNKGDPFNATSTTSAVVTYWKDFDLEDARVKLDEQGLKIAEHQEQSQKNRRKLAESTRDFKKADTEEKIKSFGALLKAYQEEVDNITKRAKFGENAFLNVYQKLYEAPDPVPALVAAADTAARLAELEQENRKFRKELEEYRAEASNLKNQQVTVRRLEERNRQLEQQMEEKVREIVEMKQRNLAEESQKNLDMIKSREEMLQEQLQTARETLANMQKLHEYSQSQLFELRAQGEEERAVRGEELTLLTDEVDRAQSRLLSLEREKESLKAQVQNFKEGSQTAAPVPEVDDHLEASLQAKERMISELHVELHNLESALAGEREEHVKEIQKLHEALEEKVSSIAALESELGQRPTSKQVDDLRKQVKILQAVGYNSIEAEDWDEAAAGVDDVSNLETLLLDKNRKLEHELTQAKVRASEKALEAEAALLRVAELSGKVEEQKALIAKLEEDILKGYARGDRRPSKEWEGSEDQGMTNILEGASKEGSEDHSMLAVVAGQRDRFKLRMNQLEEELRVAREKAKSVTTELERYKLDNVKLYEKIRYVQEYQKEGALSRKKGIMGDLESGSDVEGKYKKLYEEGINPFKEFSRKERELRYRELGLRDKITLTSGRFLLGNKYARTFIFFYSIVLHLLVFITLYRLSALSHHCAHFQEAAFIPSRNATVARAASSRLPSFF